MSNGQTPLRAVISGATGLLGGALRKRLVAPVLFSRSGVVSGVEPALVHRWDPEIAPPPVEALNGADVVFHLAGEPVLSGRWSETKKEKIYRSRVSGTRHLVQSLERCEQRPRVLVCASGIGYYGSTADRILEEGQPAGQDFLARVCVDWEAEAEAATALGMRVVNLRLGIVLSADGGAFPRLRAPFALGLGGALGSGAHWMSWIHVEDVVGLMLHAVTSELRGPVNTVSPNPVTNQDFTRTLGQLLHRPTLLNVPAFALRFALGEAAEVVLGSQRGQPKQALNSGFVFSYPELVPALAQCLALPG